MAGAGETLVLEGKRDQNYASSADLNRMCDMGGC